MNAGAAGHTLQSLSGGRCPPDAHSLQHSWPEDYPRRTELPHSGRPAFRAGDRPDPVTGEGTAKCSSCCRDPWCQATAGPRLKPRLCPAARPPQPAFPTPLPGSGPSTTPILLHRPLGLRFWGVDLRRGRRWPGDASSAVGVWRQSARWPARSAPGLACGGPGSTWGGGTMSTAA